MDIYWERLPSLSSKKADLQGQKPKRKNDKDCVATQSRTANVSPDHHRDAAVPTCSLQPPVSPTSCRDACQVLAAWKQQDVEDDDSDSLILQLDDDEGLLPPLTRIGEKNDDPMDVEHVVMSREPPKSNSASASVVPQEIQDASPALLPLISDSDDILEAVGEISASFLDEETFVWSQIPLPTDPAVSYPSLVEDAAVRKISEHDCVDDLMGDGNHVDIDMDMDCGADEDTAMFESLSCVTPSTATGGNNAEASICTDSSMSCGGNDTAADSSVEDGVDPAAFRELLNKLSESMRQSQETRKSLCMTTDVVSTDEYPRRASVLKVLKSVNSSSRQINSFLLQRLPSLDPL